MLQIDGYIIVCNQLGMYYCARCVYDLQLHLFLYRRGIPRLYRACANNPHCARKRIGINIKVIRKFFANRRYNRTCITRRYSHILAVYREIDAAANGTPGKIDDP